MSNLDKTILITGANGGVGFVMCRYFLCQGYNVIGVSRSTDKLQELDFERFSFYKLNICRKDDIIQVVNEITATETIDVLINNAAVFESKELVEQSYESMDTMIDTNLKGTIMMTKAILPSMLSAGHGKIINISSVSGCHGIENQAVYSATKHALAGFAESLNYELIPKGLQIVNICPGGIDTELWNQNNPYNGDKSRLLDPEDIAEMACHVVQSPDRIIFKNLIMFPSNEMH